MIAMAAGVDSGWRDRIANGIAAGFVLGLAWGLKDFYRRASFDDLVWILRPTQQLVTWWTGASFDLEAHHGYLSRDRLYEIVPPCAGVNFLIVVLCALSFAFVPVCRTVRGRFAAVALAACAAYGVTVLANASRIAVAMGLHEAGAAAGWLTPSRLHCAEGVAVYFLFLCVTFAAGARVAGARRELPI